MKSNRQVLVSRCPFSDHLFLCFFYLICSVPFLSVSLSSGVISGAITSQYLLEKSRIVFQVRHADIHIKDDVPCFHPKYSELYVQDRLDVWRLGSSCLSCHLYMRLYNNYDDVTAATAVMLCASIFKSMSIKTVAQIKCHIPQPIRIIQHCTLHLQRSEQTVWNSLSSSRGSQSLRKIPAVETRSYTFLYVKMLSFCFPFRPKMRETITSSTRCWQVFLHSRSRPSISKRLRLTITSTR